MKKMMLLALTALALPALAAWRGLSDDNWFSGPKISEDDLLGKVVLVECWGINCPPCRASLPKMEDVWRSWKSRPFVLLGSHRQGKDAATVADLVKKNGLTYPIYQGAGLEGEPNFNAIPFYYVVNHRGKIVSAGSSMPEASEAVVNALGDVNGNYSLTSGVMLRKYKALEKQLVFGKSIKTSVGKLKGDIKKAKLKTATAALRQQAEEAEEILKAIEAAKGDIKEDIEISKKRNPPEALKLMKKFMTTFPEDPAAVTYKGEMAEVTASAKAWAAERKAKGKAK